MMRKMASLALITLCAAAPLLPATAAPLDQKTLDAIAKRIHVALFTHQIPYTLSEGKDDIVVTITDPKQYIEAHAFLVPVCADKQSPCTVKMLPDDKLRVTPTPSH